MHLTAEQGPPLHYHQMLSPCGIISGKSFSLPESPFLYLKKKKQIVCGCNLLVAAASAGGRQTLEERDPRPDPSSKASKRAGRLSGQEQGSSQKDHPLDPVLLHGPFFQLLGESSQPAPHFP